MKYDIVYVPENAEKISHGLTINVDGKTVYQQPPTITEGKKILLKPIRNVHVFAEDELKEEIFDIVTSFEWNYMNDEEKKNAISDFLNSQRLIPIKEK